jgi:hypothetical protein
VHFVRYAELLKRRGATVIVECPSVLTRLLATCPGVDRVVATGAPLPKCDFYLPILSVAGVLGTTPESIPAHIPYLWPAAELVERWKNELGAEGGFKVGIAWQGNPNHKGDCYRSIPLAQFAPLAQVPGVHLYSLQMGPGREQLGAWLDRWPITDLGDRLGDFFNTAAAVRNLDLVITCDSAPAHVAGALGVPVWLALAITPDWRWLLERNDSPWYPTARLFRQARQGDWEMVFNEIEHELSKLARAKMETEHGPP